MENKTVDDAGQLIFLSDLQLYLVHAHMSADHRMASVEQGYEKSESNFINDKILIG